VAHVFRFARGFVVCCLSFVVVIVLLAMSSLKIYGSLVGWLAGSCRVLTNCVYRLERQVNALDDTVGSNIHTLQQQVHDLEERLQALANGVQVARLSMQDHHDVHACQDFVPVHECAQVYPAEHIHAQGDVSQLLVAHKSVHDRADSGSACMHVCQCQVSVVSPIEYDDKVASPTPMLIPCRPGPNGYLSRTDGIGSVNDDVQGAEPVCESALNTFLYADTLEDARLPAMQIGNDDAGGIFRVVPKLQDFLQLATPDQESHAMPEDGMPGLGVPGADVRSALVTSLYEFLVDAGPDPELEYTKLPDFMLSMVPREVEVPINDEINVATDVLEEMKKNTTPNTEQTTAHRTSDNIKDHLFCAVCASAEDFIVNYLDPGEQRLMQGVSRMIRTTLTGGFRSLVCRGGVRLMKDKQRAPEPVAKTSVATCDSCARAVNSGDQVKLKCMMDGHTIVCRSELIPQVLNDRWSVVCELCVCDEEELLPRTV